MYQSTISPARGAINRVCSLKAISRLVTHAVAAIVARVGATTPGRAGRSRTGQGCNKVRSILIEHEHPGKQHLALRTQCTHTDTRP